MTDLPPRRSFLGRVLGPILAIFWLTMFAATHLPQAALPQTQLGDKTEHFIGYGILGTLLAAWIGISRGRLKHPMILALIIAIAYGAVDEITQPIVNRYADLRDWIADSIGAAVGVLVASIALYARHTTQERASAPPPGGV